ncbi:unnamed protein product [Didymodactylos carnosus]|uniref:Uncharacterized protein n=1 Tax=Didymodactylos carnosus TaxID=1234261 RepID=A0A814ZPB2_9BILA|nr:unnamed protein product [Didymodactylos carnosus]CAF4015507.1 unnamed protein product [Didymodactylos carnosus]
MRGCSSYWEKAKRDCFTVIRPASGPIDDLIAYHPNDSYLTAKEIYNDLQSKTNLKLYYYDSNDTEKIKNLLPKLQPVPGTAKIHEVEVESNGDLYGKDWSNEPLKLLKIRF